MKDGHCLYEIQKNLLVFEIQILRKVSGLIQCKEGCRIRCNNELQKLIKGEDIVRYI